MPNFEIDASFGKFRTGEIPQHFLGIFEHAQGDPGETEELLVRAFCAYHPFRKLPREGTFAYLLERPAETLTSRRERHAKVTDERYIPDSINRLYDRLTTTYNERFFANVRGEHIESLDELVAPITQQIICRDWLYLVHDNGRPKEGLRRKNSYDPNIDKWFSYIAYYALWKDENGNRNSTGSKLFDSLYAKIGDYLEQATTEDLGIDMSYKDNHGNADGQGIEDKLMEMLRVYNYQQQAMGRASQCVWQDKVTAYFADEDKIDVV